jgi:hypothetical protein
MTSTIAACSSSDQMPQFFISFAGVTSCRTSKRYEDLRQEDERAPTAVGLAGERPAAKQLRHCLVGEDHRVFSAFERRRQRAQLLGAANESRPCDLSESLSHGNGDDIKLCFQLLIFVFE